MVRSVCRCHSARSKGSGYGLLGSLRYLLPCFMTKRFLCSVFDASVLASFEDKFIEEFPDVVSVFVLVKPL